MRITNLLHRSVAVTAAAAMVASLPATAIAGAAKAGQAKPRSIAGRPARVGRPPVGSQRPTREVLLSIGQGELITLPADVADVWVSNSGIADVYVSNPRQIHLFGKEFGEATLFATNAAGGVIYSANVRVSQNITSIDRMLKLAMPEADIHVSTTGQIAVLTGTVAAPDDSAQAERLVTSLLNPGVDASTPGATLKIGVFNRLRTATPLQVNLQVRFAEVSRSFIKNVGVNLKSLDSTGGFLFGIGSGRDPGTITPGVPPTPTTPGTGTSFTFLNGSQRTTLGLAGKLFGLDLLSAIDLGETIGQVSTLANPNLTALSGETGTFLAGGEVPIPISQGLGTATVEFKQYGVSLAYTPTVLADGRISLRVRPEVSQLDYSNAVAIGTTRVPGFITRRAETTVELGSGQSFMIGGLLQNNHNNSFDKTPGVGDVPILGALFRSNAFQRNETELVIVITPYLVKPVNANEIALPTDGYKAPTDLDRILLGQLTGTTPSGARPKPSMAPPAGAAPALGAVAPVPVVPAPAPQQRREEQAGNSALPEASPRSKKGASAAPGFSFN